MIYARLNGHLIAAWTIWERRGTQDLDWISHVSIEQKLAEVASMQRTYTKKQSGPRCLKRPVAVIKKKKLVCAASVGHHSSPEEEGWCEQSQIDTELGTKSSFYLEGRLWYWVLWLVITKEKGSRRICILQQNQNENGERGWDISVRTENGI